MKLSEYLQSLPVKKELNSVRLKILTRLWGDDKDPFPKPWVSSAELLDLTEQKYFDRRVRELKDELGCDIENKYQKRFSGYGWRLNSIRLSPPIDREYLTQTQKDQLFKNSDYCCAICGVKIEAGVQGLQADHKIPLSRGGSNEIENWQPMCNNCNVGKRSACKGCNLECNTCSWAFPEVVGVRTIINISEQTLRKVNLYVADSGKTISKVMEEAAEYFIEQKKD